MSEIKWIKIASYIFEDEKIRLIDAMVDGVMVIYVWIRLLVQAGKINAGGYIYLNENISYTEEMLATLFCKPLESIKFALKTLCDFQMIEIDSSNIIKILNWEKHQNIEGMERVRAQNRSRAKNHREKEKQIGNAAKDNSIENSEENICDTKNNKVDVTNNSCNVTQNENNVTVTEQNKRESKKEIEIENKKESENKKDINHKDNNIPGDINNKSPTHDEDVNGASLSQVLQASSLTQSESIKESPIATAKKSIDIKAMDLLKYFEKITGKVGSLNFGAVKLAIDMHGENQVKLAIDRALEVNKPDMTYINGILKNWRREGYPNQREEIKNGVRSIGKSNAADKNEFTGFKPKKPRNLTESERKGAEEKLI